ncbi:hypothetical protein M885DRAFT_514713 [Pelagophyceae sp. CCMP2097]|nr:hypothetical protein M885DRAFT_514713 [Pelagophyceae sp. CCMP2097]
MEIHRLVMPTSGGCGLPDTTAETVKLGRDAFAYRKVAGFEEQPSKQATGEAAATLGRESLQLWRSNQVGYTVGKKKSWSDDEASEAGASDGASDDDASVGTVQLGGTVLDVAAMQSDTDLMMDMDWDTSTWSLREIEKGCATLIRECKAAAPTVAGQARRAFAERMLVRLVDRHRAALQYVARSLENLVDHALPGPASPLDDRCFNLAPLLAKLAPLHRFAEQLLRLQCVRRVVGLLLRTAHRAAAVVQCQVRLRRAGAVGAPTVGDARGADYRADVRRKRFLLVMEWDAVCRHWRKREEPRRGADDDFGRAKMLHRATRASLQILAALCSSPLAGVADEARREACEKGRGATALVCLARRPCSDEVRREALRVLVLIAALPPLSKHLLNANVAGVCVHLLNPAEARPVRVLALDVLQALALSVLTCCRVEDDYEPADDDASASPSASSLQASTKSQLQSQASSGSLYGSSRSPSKSPPRRLKRRPPEKLAKAEDAVRLMARPRWVGAALALLGDADEILFVGALRFAHRCACCCDAALETVLVEFVALGGLALARCVENGLGSARAGQPLAEAALDLIAQLCTRPAGRRGLERAHAHDLVAPLLASGDAASPPFLRSLLVLLLMARQGDGETALPGAFGDVAVADADSEAAALAAKAFAGLRNAAQSEQRRALCGYIRNALNRICATSTEDLNASGAALARLGAAAAIVEFAARPADEAFLYGLGREARDVHCVSLHRLFTTAPPLPRQLLDVGGPGLLRFAGYAVQAGCNEIVDGTGGAAHALATEAALRMLSCAAAVADEAFLDGFRSVDARLADATLGRATAQRVHAAHAASALDNGGGEPLRRSWREDQEAAVPGSLEADRGARADALLESADAPRARVEAQLLSSALLADVVRLVSLAPTVEACELDPLKRVEAGVVAAACGLLAAAAPVPAAEKVAGLAVEPPVSDEASFAAAEVTLRRLRGAAVQALLLNVAPSAPLAVRAAACAALARLGGTRRGAAALAAAGVVRALAALAPSRPVTQHAVDAVLQRGAPAEIAADVSAERISATQAAKRVETCKLVALPVAWFACAASCALSPDAARAMLELRVARRCVERFGVSTDKPQLDWAIRAAVAKLLGRLAIAASETDALGPRSGDVHDFVLADRYAVAPLLCTMLAASANGAAAAVARYHAVAAIAALCASNVAASVPRLVEQGALRTLARLLLDRNTPAPLLRHILAALRNMIRFPDADFATQLVSPTGALSGAASDPPARAESVLHRLNAVSIDIELLKQQRMAQRAVTLNELARDLLGALNEATRLAAAHHKARARRGAVGSEAHVYAGDAAHPPVGDAGTGFRDVADRFQAADDAASAFLRDYEEEPEATPPPRARPPSAPPPRVGVRDRLTPEQLRVLEDHERSLEGHERSLDDAAGETAPAPLSIIQQLRIKAEAARPRPDETPRPGGAGGTGGAESPGGDDAWDEAPGGEASGRPRSTPSPSLDWPDNPPHARPGGQFPRAEQRRASVPFLGTYVDPRETDSVDPAAAAAPSIADIAEELRRTLGDGCVVDVRHAPSLALTRPPPRTPQEVFLAPQQSLGELPRVGGRARSRGASGGARRRPLAANVPDPTFFEHLARDPAQGLVKRPTALLLPGIGDGHGALAVTFANIHELTVRRRVDAARRQRARAAR